MKKKVNIEQVKEFWEEHPLCAYEIKYPVASTEFFDEHSRLKIESTDRFNLHLWEFDKHKNEKVLDVGCGIGWLVQEFAKGGAKITGIDLTQKAIETTEKRLAMQGLQANLLQANAEMLPFEDNSFDFVTCSGVLHHTPNTLQAIDEIRRVTKPESKAVISLYYRSMAFHRLLWPITRIILKKVFKKTGFRNESEFSTSIDDFVRLYDGDRNPLGKAYSKREFKQMLSGFSEIKLEKHYFPSRFFDNIFKIKNERVLRMLDKWLGTMIFAICKK